MNEANKSEHKNLIEALYFVDVKELDHDDWVKFGTALKTENINNFDIWNDWSKNDPRYNPKIMQSTWRSFKVGKVKPGTIYKYAQQRGFKGTLRPPGKTGSSYTEQTRTSQQKKKEVSKERLDEIKHIKYQSVLNLDSSEQAQAYLTERGITLETAHKYQLGTRDDRAILIPTKTGYLERFIDKNATTRYKNCKNIDTELFNEDAINQESIQAIYVCEGAFDALSLLQEGYTAIALNSVSNKDNFVSKYIESKCKAPVILCLDNDEPGKKATEALEIALNDITTIALINIPEGIKDVNEWYLNDKKGLLEEMKRIDNLVSNKKDELEAYKATSNAFKVEAIGKNFNTEPIKTGFNQLDYVLSGGLYDGLYILGASTGLGKTTFALQICDYIAQNGHDVLIFSLEMSATELMSRSLSRITCELSNSFKSVASDRYAKTEIEIKRKDLYKTYTPEELEIIEQAKEKYKEYANHIYTIEGIGNISALDVRTAINKHIELTGNKPVVLIDYIQLLAPIGDKYTEIRESIDKNILELKRITRDMQLPIIAISSMNRSGYKAEADNSNFKESGAIEYTATVTMQLSYRNYIKDKKDEDIEAHREPREMKLNILKNRQGVPGKTIDFNYYSAYNRYIELKQLDQNNQKQMKEKVF